MTDIDDSEALRAAWDKWCGSALDEESMRVSCRAYASNLRQQLAEANAKLERLEKDLAEQEAYTGKVADVCADNKRQLERLKKACAQSENVRAALQHYPQQRDVLTNRALDTLKTYAFYVGKALSTQEPAGAAGVVPAFQVTDAAVNAALEAFARSRDVARNHGAESMRLAIEAGLAVGQPPEPKAAGVVEPKPGDVVDGATAKAYMLANPGRRVCNAEHPDQVYMASDKGEIWWLSELAGSGPNNDFVYGHYVSHRYRILPADTAATGVDPQRLWSNVDKAVAEVASWPAWKRGVSEPTEPAKPGEVEERLENCEEGLRRVLEWLLSSHTEGLSKQWPDWVKDFRRSLREINQEPTNGDDK